METYRSCVIATDSILPWEMCNARIKETGERETKPETRNQQITENETKQNKTYERLNAFSTLGLGERYVKYIIHFQVCNFVPRW